MTFNLNFLNKIYLLLFLTLSLPFAGTAQRDICNWEVTPYAGLLTLNNDITLPQNTSFFTYGLRLDRRVGDAFTVGLNFSYIHPDNSDQNDIAGSFLGVTYHWDNGYLFSKRSAVSIFNRLEAGYTDKIGRIENLESTTGQMTFGFENGLKFRFGDRLSADLSLEILGSKQSIVEGVFIDNLRYNIWKVGVSYHFGSRRSSFVPPVFVPSGFIVSNSNIDKLTSKEDSLWIADISEMILPDTLEKINVPDSLPSKNKSLTVSRADSLAIFMHFDSLYQRRELIDTTGTIMDLHGSEMKRFESDSLIAIPDSIVPFHDSIVMSSDSIEKLDSDSLILADTGSQNSEPTVRQKNDSTALRGNSQLVPDSIKTVNVSSRSDDDKENFTATGSAEKEKNASQDQNDISDDDQSGSGALSSDQVKQINQNQKNIEKLEAEHNEGNNNNGNKSGGLGNAIAAGAAGAAVGALVSKNKKQNPDTVFYVSAATQAKIDSLQREINALKQKLAGNVVPEKNTVVAPVVGMYYGADSSYTDTLITDSLHTDSLRNDSIRTDSVSVDYTNADSIHSDSLGAMADTLALSLVNPGKIAPSSAQLPDSAVLISPTDSLAIDSVLWADAAAEMLRIDTIADNSFKPLLAKYPVSCNFGLNSTAILAADTAQLNRVVTDLKQDFNRSVILIGHTDKSGNADYNLRLSKRRAASVRDYLTDRGVDQGQIAIESKGAKDAVERYNQNARRVDIRIGDP